MRRSYISTEEIIRLLESGDDEQRGIADLVRQWMEKRKIDGSHS